MALFPLTLFTFPLLISPHPSTINFSRRPTIIKNASDVTKYAFDRTQALSEVLHAIQTTSTISYQGDEDQAMNELLGELEYSFISFNKT